jgi:hypothetical protein
VALLLAKNSWSASSQSPTKQEIFELRSLCGALADRAERAENAKTAGGMLYTYRGHYDPSTNRCVEKVKTFFVAYPELQQDILLDAQSNALLAQCRFYTDHPIDSSGWECEINHKDAAHEQTEEFIDAMMGTDN